MPPIYEYVCDACEEVTERERSVQDRRKRVKCIHCGSTRTRIIISSNAFQLVGSGWYVTDYKGKGK